MIPVGKIVKAHGIAGELKIVGFMDSLISFTHFKRLYVQNECYSVKKIRAQNDFVLAKLVGVDSMNDAEKLRDQTVFVPEDDLPALEEDRFYIHDVIGCSIRCDGIIVGKIVDVLQYGSADVIVFRGSGTTGMFPWVKDLNVSVDKAEKVFTVEPKRFAEVVSYED